MSIITIKPASCIDHVEIIAGEHQGDIGYVTGMTNATAQVATGQLFGGRMHIRLSSFGEYHEMQSRTAVNRTLCSHLFLPPPLTESLQQTSNRCAQPNVALTQPLHRRTTHYHDQHHRDSKRNQAYCLGIRKSPFHGPA